MYSFSENKKTYFSITALLMLFMSIVCLILRIDKVDEVLNGIGYTKSVAPKDWAIVALTFCFVAFIMITTALTFIRKEGEYDNTKANWLFYGGLVIGIIAASVTLASVHQDYDFYQSYHDAIAMVPQYSSATLDAGETWLANVGLPFIPMVISSVVQGLILIVAAVIDLSGTSTTGVDMVSISKSTSNRKLSDRSFVGNLNETISSFKDYAPVNKPKAKPKADAKTVAKAKVAKSYTEAEFQAKLNRELKPKKADTFDDMVKRVSKAEKLLKSGDMSQKDFDTYKTKQLEKFK